jgi:hypothetical protein
VRAWAELLRRAQLGRRHVDAPGDQPIAMRLEKN